MLREAEFRIAQDLKLARQDVWLQRAHKNVQRRSCVLYELFFASAGAARDVNEKHGVRVSLGEGIGGYYSGEGLATRDALAAQEPAERLGSTSDLGVEVVTIWSPTTITRHEV